MVVSILFLSSETKVNATINYAIAFGGNKINQDDEMTVVVAKIQ